MRNLILLFPIFITISTGEDENYDFFDYEFPEFNLNMGNMKINTTAERLKIEDHNSK